MGRIPAPKPAKPKPTVVKEERITATGTWNRPPDVNWVEVTAVGGGASGSGTPPAGPQRNAPSGGGAGGYVKRWVPVDGPVPVVIGAGGVFALGGSDENAAGGDTIWDGPVPVTAFGAQGFLTQNFGAGTGGRATKTFGNDFNALGGSGGGAGGPGNTWVDSPTNFGFMSGIGVRGQQGFPGSPGVGNGAPIPTPNFSSFSSVSRNGGAGIDNIAGGGAGNAVPTVKGHNGVGGFGGAPYGQDGLANTGGGGGGAAQPGPGITSGGSGVVIVRYRSQ